MISLVMPVHNEEKILQANLEKIMTYLDSLGEEFEVVLVENGSSDNTPVIADELSKKDKRIKALSIPSKNLGRALKKGILSASGKYLIWYPIDLSIAFDYIRKSLKEIKDYDVIVGSKALRDSVDDRPLGRKIYSIVYNFLVNLLFNLHISDTQCVKTFRRDSVVPIVEETKSGGIIFEVELLHKARRYNLKIKEIPLDVRDVRLDSKINFGVIGKTFCDIISLRMRI